jgi:hypothetical protein
MATTNHDEYWKQVKADSEECVEELFDEGGAASLADVLGHSRGLASRRDAKSVLAYVMRHGDACETACAVLALGETGRTPATSSGSTARLPRRVPGRNERGPREGAGPRSFPFARAPSTNKEGGLT